MIFHTCVLEELTLLKWPPTESNLHSQWNLNYNSRQDRGSLLIVLGGKLYRQTNKQTKIAKAILNKETTTELGSASAQDMSYAVSVSPTPHHILAHHIVPFQRWASLSFSLIIQGRPPPGNHVSLLLPVGRNGLLSWFLIKMPKIYIREKTASSINGAGELNPNV